MTLVTLLTELRNIPVNDHQFTANRSDCIAQLDAAYYRFRDTKERNGWRCLPTLGGYSVYNSSGAVVGTHQIETWAWAYAEQSES